MARKMTEWPSKRGPITKIMPSDGCIGDTVPLAVGKWYDFHEFGWYMGNVGYSWSKEFLESGKRWLAADTARAATSSEVTDLRREARQLKEVSAEQTLNLRLLKKTCSRVRREHATGSSATPNGGEE